MVDHTQGHTVKRYDGELNHLNVLLLNMGERVLLQVAESLAAFKDRDIARARRVVHWDREVDRLEVQADDEIVKLLARRCPMGGDLRMVMAVSKGISDLERIGDEAVRIAGLAMQIFAPEGKDPGNQLLQDVGHMGSLALTSLHGALEVFEVWNEDKALQVIENQNEMDEAFQAELRRLMTYVMEDARNVGFAISVVLVIKALERIGHHAKNLAEYVIFQVKGQDIRADDSAGFELPETSVAPDPAN